MRHEVRVPTSDEGVESAKVVEVLVAVGDRVEAEQGVVAVETDKAITEIPTDKAGQVVQVHVEPDQEVHPGDVLVTLEAAAS